ncbi:MAG: hypothetical protein LBL13_09595 [Bacteroidales bacterium]|jgi:hypothetical protein|nr:hypothetical protein [Bacteroidales bacterium]
MYLVFNELSFLEYKNSSELLGNFIAMGNIFNKAKDTYGFTHLLFPCNLSVIQVTQEQKFVEWLGGLNTGEKNKICAIANKRPFTEDYLGDKKDETLKYYFVSAALNIEQEYCDGLATADIMDIPSISLTHNEIWKNRNLKIFKETDDVENPESVFVHNVASDEVLLCDDFKDFCESISNIELVPATLSFEERKRNIHFRDDHGTDVLQKFAERIIRNDYVEAVINSLPFNNKTSRFIRRVYKSGLIEIVLHWEDSGFGMVIQTTGRNYRETEAIANILKEEFDK